MQPVWMLFWLCSVCAEAARAIDDGLAGSQMAM
jgi:hypothetical protein